MRPQGRLSDTYSAGTDREALVPALTLLFHPDVRRVGEVVLPVEGRWTVALPAGAVACLTARPAGEGLHLRLLGASLRVNGSPCTERLVTRAELESGVVLEVGDELALLLHLTVDRACPYPALGLLGESAAVRAVRVELACAAALTVPVLVRGESGTGKELAARAIAQAGARAGRPFVAVNLAGIPSSIAASELLGHAAGAFTGAAAAHSGHFQQADGGTLFLDEIGAAPLDVQALLLRAIETLEIQPLGAARPRPVDVRVIAATDEDLEAAIRQGRFRAALYHRLAGYEIVMPPLRRRRDDIARLLFHFLGQELRALGAEERLRDVGPGRWLSAAAVGSLVRADWPGNVRQLANASRRLALAALHGQRAAVTSLGSAPPLLEEDAPAAASPPGPRRAPSTIREEELLAALRGCHWQMSEAARRLGISRTTLYALVERSERLRKAKDLSEPELRQAFDACEGRIEAMAEALEVSPRGIQLRLRDVGIHR